MMEDLEDTIKIHAIEKQTDKLETVERAKFPSAYETCARVNAFINHTNVTVFCKFNGAIYKVASMKPIEGVLISIDAIDENLVVSQIIREYWIPFYFVLE